MSKSPNIILELTIEFSLEIIRFCEVSEEKRKINLSNQLFRSGTSIGANVHESQSCESRADFIHKMKLAAKEAEETKYWLTLCNKAETYPKPEDLVEKLQIIIKIINKIIVSSKLAKT